MAGPLQLSIDWKTQCTGKNRKDTLLLKGGKKFVKRVKFFRDFSKFLVSQNFSGSDAKFHSSYMK